jgi:hypothetical protein
LSWPRVRRAAPRGAARLAAEMGCAAQCHFANCIGRPKYHKVIQGGISGEYVVGPAVRRARSKPTYRCPNRVPFPPATPVGVAQPGTQTNAEALVGRGG